jgi:predicted phosphodiesterase
VDLVASLPNVTYLKGNHEDYFNTPSAILRELELVQIFFNHTFPMFDRHEIIKHLPEQVKIDTYIATHTINNLRIYENTDIEINNNFIIGHSHYQFIRKVNNYTIFNPGSLGQNRKNIKIANYAVYDTDQKKFDLRGFEYDTAPLFRAMKNQKYPQACIDYYVSKITS